MTQARHSSRSPELRPLKNIPLSPEERFNRFALKGSGLDDCWLWQGSLLDGYGQFSIQGKAVYSHVAAYLLFVGPIEQGKIIAHLCHNRACVNPKHLLQTTHKRNAEQREEVGRGNHVRGSRVGSAKLTEENVLFIKRNLDMPNSVLAEMFGLLNQGTVWNIKNEVTWKHVQVEDRMEFRLETLELLKMKYGDSEAVLRVLLWENHNCPASV